MSDQTSKNTWMHESGKAWDCFRPAGTPWLAVGLAAGAALGASAGALGWGLSVGAAIGLALQQAHGKKEPARQ